jgi:hypothetical protein
MVFLAGYLICAFMAMVLYFIVAEGQAHFREAIVTAIFWPLFLAASSAALIADKLSKKLNER